MTHSRGTDLILSNSSGEPCEIAGNGRRLRSDGELAFASFDADGLRTLALIGGTFAGADGRRIEPFPTVEGLLTEFDDVGKTLVIRPDVDVSCPDAFLGKTVTIRHRERASAYTIASVKGNSDDGFVLHLDGFPHLATGYLLVTAVENGCAWVGASSGDPGQGKQP